MPATALEIITTTTANRFFPSNNEKPKHSIMLLEFLKVLVEYVNFNNFRPLYPVTNSKWSPLIHHTR